MHLTHLTLLAPLLLAAVSSASPTRTTPDAHLVVPNAHLMPRATPTMSGDWPEPTGGVTYAGKWPNNVVPETGEGFMLGWVPSFISSSHPQSQRAAEVTLIYVVVRAGAPDVDGLVVHTLGLVLEQYASDKAGWKSVAGSFYQGMLVKDKKAKTVGWKKVGLATSPEGLKRALDTIPPIPVPEPGSAPLSPEELQSLRRKWLEDALSLFQAEKSILQLDLGVQPTN